MDAVKVGLGSVADIKLGAAGVLAGMGHGQGARLVLLAIDLAVDLVARAAGAGGAAGALTAIGAATLGHETGNYPMEGQAVVEALFGELGEVGHGFWRINLKEFEFDAAGIRFHQGFGHEKWG